MKIVMNFIHLRIVVMAIRLTDDAALASLDEATGGG
jgi:hypothetical protein